MNQHQRPGQFHGLRRQGAVQADERIEEEDNHQIHRAQRHDAPLHHLLEIEGGLLLVPGAYALTHHRHHGKAHSLTHNGADAVQVVCHGVGGGLGGAEEGDHAHHQQSAELEEAVFTGGGNADAQNLAHDLPVDGVQGGSVQRQLLTLPAGHGQNHDCRHCPGNQCRHSHTGHPHFQYKHTQGISRHVDTVHPQTHLHGNLAVAHAAENGRAGVIQGNEGEGQSGDTQIDQARGHHVIGNGAEEQLQKPPGKYQAQGHHQAAHGKGQAHQLARAAPGIRRPPGTQQLARHHRAAGGQRREKHQNHRVDHVNQGHAGDGRFADGGNHHAVAHAH